MKSKLFKVVLICLLCIKVVVCNCAGEKIYCGVNADEKNEVATIDVLFSDSGDEISESDIILYIESTVSQCKEDGVSKIIVNLSSGIINEDNLAALVDGIDVICVRDNEKLSHMTEGTLITYVKDDVVAETETADNTVVPTDNSHNANVQPMKKMNSIFITAFALLAFSILLLLILRAKKNK